MLSISPTPATATIAERHAEYVLAEINHISELLAGHREVEGVTHLSELWPNLRAAIDWACTTGNLSLATALVRPIAVQGFLRRGTGEIGDWAERILAMTPRDEEETIALCLLWAGFRYSLTRDRAGYARLVEQYGDPDHVLVRYARLAVDDRTQEAVAVGPLAIAALRRRGDEQIATLLEIFLVGSLLGAGRLEEAEAQADALTERFRAEGPPTFLNWTLFMQGAYAAFQGDHDRVDQLYEESASVEVPARTNSPNEVLEARTAFRRGHHWRAFQILRSYIDELLEADNMQAAAFVSIEFINMMTEIDRLPEAAHILGHLDTTGLLDVEGPGFKMLVLAAADKVASHPGATAAWNDAVEREVDERNALRYMRDVLDQLLNQRPVVDPA